MKPEGKLLHIARIPIRWGDMDAFGHVNNTVYFRYMEQTRVEWFERSGFKLDPASELLVIVNASCTFLLPLTYPGTVEVRMSADPPGRSSVQSHYLMLGLEDGRRYAEGAAKIVWMNPHSARSAPLPERLRSLLA